MDSCQTEAHSVWNTSLVRQIANHLSTKEEGGKAAVYWRPFGTIQRYENLFHFTIELLSLRRQSERESSLPAEIDPAQ